MREDVEWRESSNRRCLAGRGLAKLADLWQICGYGGSYEAPRTYKKLCYDITWKTYTSTMMATGSVNWSKGFAEEAMLTRRYLD